MSGRLAKELNAVARMHQLDLSDPNASIFKSSTSSPEDYHHSIFSGYTEAGMSIVDGGLTNASTNMSVVVVGQGIKRNHGIQLASISKIPNYSLGTRDDISNSSHHVSQKGKTILSGLGVSNDTSSITSVASNSSLNQQLIKLPVVRDTDELPKERATNGLPYYSKAFATATIKKLNRTHNVDDVEYLHGCVVLNKFLNNKRLLRTYQWRMYFNDKMGGKPLASQVKGDVEVKEEGEEVVIREDVPVETPSLPHMINKIPMERRSDALLSSPGIIRSKIVTKRRKPSPNALGHSNIRIHKPRYL